MQDTEDDKEHFNSEMKSLDLFLNECNKVRKKAGVSQKRNLRRKTIMAEQLNLYKEVQQQFIQESNEMEQEQQKMLSNMNWMDHLKANVKAKYLGIPSVEYSHHCATGPKVQKYLKAVLIEENGSKYIGEQIGLKNFKYKHGNGVMIYKDGGVYKGQWQFGERNGHGQHIQADGNVYEGDYLQNKQHGHGTLEYSNDNTYTGYFKNDKKDGLGQLKKRNGSTEQGIWQNDILYKELSKDDFKQELQDQPKPEISFDLTNPVDKENDPTKHQIVEDMIQDIDLGFQILLRVKIEKENEQKTMDEESIDPIMPTKLSDNQVKPGSTPGNESDCTVESEELYHMKSLVVKQHMSESQVWHDFENTETLERIKVVEKKQRQKMIKKVCTGILIFLPCAGIITYGVLDTYQVAQQLEKITQANFDISNLKISAGSLIKADDIATLRPFVQNIAASKCNKKGANGYTEATTDCNSLFNMEYGACCYQFKSKTHPLVKLSTHGLSKKYQQSLQATGIPVFFSDPPGYFCSTAKDLDQFGAIDDNKAKTFGFPPQNKEATANLKFTAKCNAAIELLASAVSSTFVISMM